MNAFSRPSSRELQAGLALRIEHRPVEALIPYARNARTHSEAQVALIAGSIREFGFTTPVLVDGENGVIAGHGRLLAARKLGLDEVPVIELGASEPGAEAGATSWPTTSSPSGPAGTESCWRWRPASCADLGVDLAALGFEAGEIDDLLHGGEPDPREEETPGAARAAGVAARRSLAARPAPGALRRRHRSPATWRACSDGVEPQLMVDAIRPMASSYDPAWRNRSGASRTERTGKVLNDDRADWREAWALFPGDVAYVWHGALHAGTVAESLVACRLRDPLARSSGRRSGWC